MAGYLPPLRFHALTPFYDSAVRWTTNERAFRKAMLGAISVGRPLANVLDIGCGTGSYAIMLKEAFPTARVVGLDADDQALGIARRKAAGLRLDIEFRRADARQPPFPDASFDAASSSLFFHHLNDADKLEVLRQLHRCLEPGGRLVVADWDRPASTFGRMRFALVRSLDGFAVTRLHAHGGFPALLGKAGFEISGHSAVAAPLGCIGVWTCARR